MNIIHTTYHTGASLRVRPIPFCLNYAILFVVNLSYLEIQFSLLLLIPANKLVFHDRTKSQADRNPTEFKQNIEWT